MTAAIERTAFSRPKPKSVSVISAIDRFQIWKSNRTNPRKLTGWTQIQAIAKSIKEFGFNAPIILIDKSDGVLAGHGRLEAARLLGLVEVPVISLGDLTVDQARAYMIADNRLTDLSSWDEGALAVHLKELSDLALDFDIEATGFELPEIDQAD